MFQGLIEPPRRDGGNAASCQGVRSSRLPRYMRKRIFPVSSHHHITVKNLKIKREKCERERVERATPCKPVEATTQPRAAGRE